jgi:hypothetical protein
MNSLKANRRIMRTRTRSSIVIRRLKIYHLDVNVAGSFSKANVPTLIASNSSIPTRTVTPILFFSVITHLLVFVCIMN